MNLAKRIAQSIPQSQPIKWYWADWHTHGVREMVNVGVKDSDTLLDIDGQFEGSIEQLAQHLKNNYPNVQLVVLETTGIGEYNQPDEFISDFQSVMSQYFPQVEIE